MDFFNELPQHIKDIAFRQLAEDLLDNYLMTEDDSYQIEQTLMEALENQENKQCQDYYRQWKEEQDNA